MMLAATLFLLQAAAPMPAGPPEGDLAEIEEITVVAQRLRQISVAVTRDAQGQYQCGLSQSTGLLALDGELCKATTGCVRKGKDGPEAVRACVDKARPSLTARIRDFMRAEQGQAGA